MNYKMMGKFLSQILIVEAGFMVPALLISLYTASLAAVYGFGLSILITAGVGALMYYFCRNSTRRFFAREGMVCVAGSWIAISFFGCLPFVFSREIPNFVDALFEIVSGFTTTGSSILGDVEALSPGIMYWRSFSHWLGGMGVLVFLLALSPNGERGKGYTMHLLRAESPGPNVNKLVPKMRTTARILYVIYMVLTFINFLFLLLGKMPVFDAVCTAFGTAGTGGFGIRNDSIAGYSPYIQNVCTVFMFLFGINFSCYYLLLVRHVKEVLKDQELRLYIIIFVVSILLITFNIRGLYGSWEETIRHAAFQVSSIMTTTGFASTDFDLWPGIMYWRSFSHWLGGMGVLVFLLALSPNGERGKGYTMHLLRAESPGPNVNKLVPKMRTTARILYVIYMVLTFINFLFLLLGKMPVFDAVCTAFGTAGTGGFGIRNDSIAGYSPYIQNVCTVFMFLFGINFSCYYLLLVRHVKEVLKDQELRLYIIIFVVSILLITFNIRGLYGSWEETIRHAAFQVSSIMTTTGFASTDFDLWPGFSKALLLCLMFVGACAGSTAGGLKMGRLLLILKNLRRNIRRILSPQRVEVVRMNGNRIGEDVLNNTNTYLAAYGVILVGSFLLISIDGLSMTTNVSAVAACFNNIGPGFDVVGPTCNFSVYSWFSKLVLIFDMLAGRLEIFPMLVLFSRSTWRHK